MYNKYPTFNVNLRNVQSGHVIFYQHLKVSKSPSKHKKKYLNRQKYFFSSIGAGFSNFTKPHTI